MTSSPSPEPDHRRTGPVLPVIALAAPGIPDRHRPVDLKQCLPQHPPQFRKAGGAQHRKPGDLRQEQRVEAAVVSLAVGPHQTRPVHPQHHMEPLGGPRHGSACRSPAGGTRKYTANTGSIPCLARPAGHGDAMPSAMATSKNRSGNSLAKGAGRWPSAMGGGDGADAPVLRGAGGQRPAEHGREVVSPALLHKARLRIEWPHAVELVRVLLREGVAPALHGLHVDHHRALELPGPGQHVDQPVQVVAVDGPR